MPLFLIRGKLLVKDGELPMIFKAAILQMRSAYREYEENIKTIIRYMSEAKKNNADILLLPECFITGYDLTITNDFALAEKDLEPLCAAAKELKATPHRDCASDFEHNFLSDFCENEGKFAEGRGAKPSGGRPAVLP